MISAVLLGGVASTGGSGSLLGVVAAVAFIGVLDNGLLLVGVPAFWSQVSAGVALVLAAGMNALTSLRRRGPGHSRAGQGQRMNRTRQLRWPARMASWVRIGAPVTASCALLSGCYLPSAQAACPSGSL